MTLSTRHRGTLALTAPEFLLRTAIGLLATFLAVAAPARAQGLIQFSVGSGTYPQYQVRDNGTGLRTLPIPQSPAPRIHASNWSDYPGGRKYLYPADNNLRVWSEVSGKNKAVTNFKSPYSITLSSNLWSNDGLDSFVSFFVYNSTLARLSLYRAHVSAIDLSSASYQPVTLGDSRLEFLMDWPTDSYPFYGWNHDGSGFYYTDSRDSSKVRFKTVGVGNTADDDPIVFVAPAQLSDLRVSPANDHYLVASTMPIGTGILAIDLQTSTSWLVASQPTSSVAGIRGACFSPDGSTIAFGNSRSVTTTVGKKKTTTVYYGVYLVPFIGGSIARITEVTGTGFLTVNSWKLP